MPTPSPRLRCVAGLAPALVLLAGCATTDPRATLPAVQRHLATRSDVTAAWPLTNEDRTALDDTTHALLAAELTPTTAVQVAVTNNRRLRATFEGLGLSQADVSAATRLHNPTLGVSVRWPDQRPRGPNAEFSLVADLLDNLLLPLRAKVARAQLAQAERRVAYEVLALAADVKSAVYTAQTAQLYAARAADLARVNTAAADLSQRQFDAGNINRLDLAHQQLAAQESSLTQSRAQATARTEHEKLTRLLGLTGPAATAWKLSPELPVPPATEPALDTLDALALTTRLDLAIATSRVALAESALDLKRKTRLLPGVSVGVSTERESSGDRLTGPSLELGLPLFDQGQPELARLASDLRRAQAEREALSGEIQSEVREARDTLLAARATVTAYEEKILPQRRLILRETLLHYNAMQKSTYELLAAKEQALHAEREALEARRDYWLARVQLERALGGRLPQ